MQEKEYIYVLNDDGSPLMPTTRRQHVNRLLKTHQAHIVTKIPFTIQLHYHSPGITQPLHGGTDCGRTNIGEGVIDNEGKAVFTAHLTSNNKDVPKHMSERKEHRQASRRGERLARKRLARKHKTLSSKLKDGRILPGCEEPLEVKDIINTEARFNNRKKKEPLTPTIRHLILTHINMIKKILSILPVTDWTIELNKFSFMELKDASVRGVDFQNGRMKDYPSMHDYVFALQEGKCKCCGGKIEHYHHIIPKSKGGSDLPENMIGICLSCHEKIHTGKITLPIKGLYKKYAGTSVLNQALPYIIEEIKKLFGEENTHLCTGYETKVLRESLGLLKDHPVDALVIAAVGSKIKQLKLPSHIYEIRQFRRHNRARIHSQRERTYYLNGKMICKNRHKRFEQKEDSLAELRERYGESITSHLSVKKSIRRYNDMGRILPGAVFYYKNERHILSGMLSNGKYYRAVDDTKKKKTNYPAKDCFLVRRNEGLVYIS